MSDSAGAAIGGPERVLIRPSRRQRIAASIIAGVAFVFAVGVVVLSVVTIGPVVGLITGLISACLPGAFVLATIRNLARPVVCSRHGIAGLRITRKTPAPDATVKKVWRSRFAYHPEPVPWRHVAVCGFWTLPNYSSGSKMMTYPVIFKLDDGRFARTGFAETSRRSATRTVATIEAQRSKWHRGLGSA